MKLVAVRGRSGWKTLKDLAGIAVLFIDPRDRLGPFQLIENVKDGVRAVIDLAVGAHAKRKPVWSTCILTAPLLIWKWMLFSATSR